MSGMNGFLKISDAASLALHTMAVLNENPDTKHSVKDIAKILVASEAHLSKVMQRLSKVGMVKSTRGPGGGFKMAKGGSDITLLEVFEAIDGPVGTDWCLLNQKRCTNGDCIMGGMVETVNNKVKSYLEITTLAKLEKNNWVKHVDN